nr:MAG TPA: tail tape measure protein [Caudoviricetes sp.]
MGNIDNLNFKIILDDKDFNAKIKANLEVAKAFNTEVSKLLDVQKEHASAMRQVAESIRDSARATGEASRAVENHADQLRRRTKEMQDGNKEVERQSKLMRSLSGFAGAYFSVDGARRFVSELTRITGEFEKQQVALRAILQDAGGADEIFDKIKKLAVMSPFSVLDLTSYAKQLSAYSVPLDEIYDTTKMLADVSAGLGVDMGRIVLAYGQIRSASFLRGTEVRQLTEAGIPILEELSKQFEELEGHAVSAGEVFNKISARQVPFEMVEKAFKDMTSEGGKFYEMQEVLADTLAGKISNLRDAFQIMMSNIGNANSGVLKGSVDILTKIISNSETIGQDLVALAATYGTYKVVVYGMAVATQGFVNANLALTKSLLRVKAAMITNKWAFIAAAAVAAAYAIYRVVTAETELEKAQKAVNNAVDEFRAKSNSEISNLDYLWRRLNKAAVGTAEYEEARKRLINTYGRHMTEIDKEALAVGNLAGVYDRLKESIIAAEKEKAVSEGMSKISKAHADRLEKLYATFNSMTKGFNKGLKAELQDYVKGDISKSDLSKSAKVFYDKFSTYSPMAGKSKNAFDALRDSIAEAEEDTRELRTTLEETIGFVYGSKQKTEPALSGFEKRVQAVLDKYPNVKGLQSLSTKGKDYWTYIDSMRKFYAENVKKLQDAGGLDEGDSVVQNIKKQNEVIKQIFSEAFGGKVSLYDIKTRTKQENVAQKAIESRIKLVKEMSSRYAKMKAAGIGDESIRSKFDSVYDESDRDLYKTFDFEQTLARLEAQLVKAGSAAAESAKSALRTQELDSFTEAFIESSKALKKWIDFYDEISENVPESSNDSFGARVQRILNKLNASNFKDAQSANKALTNLTASESAYIEKMGQDAWIKYSDAGLDAIARWTKAAKRANIDVAQQSLQSLGKSYLDTFFTSKGIDMNNLRDKSFGQLKSMLDALNSVDTNGLIPESVLNRAKELGIDTQPLLDFIKQSINAKKQDIFGALLGDITKQANAYSASLGDIEGTLKRIKELNSLVEFKKASGDESVGKDELSLSQETELLKAQLKSPYAYMEGIAKAAGTAAKYMKDFAEATGDTNLEGIANSLSAISQTLSAAAQGGASGGWIGAVVAGVADALGQITSAIIEEKAAIAKTAEAMENFREQIYLTRFQVNEDDYETIFGTRVIAKASEAYRKAGAAMAEYKKAITTTMAAPSESEVYDTLDQTLSPKYLARMEAFKKGYTELEGLMVMTKHRSALAKSFGKKNEYAALKDLVPELFEGGEFNLENAEAFLENKNAIRYWDKYNKGVVEAIQHTVELAKANKESEAILENAVSDIFSNMASDFSDIIFDAVINGSDAWSQFREKGSEAILDLGKQLMQEMMITEYFDQFSKDIKEAYGLESPELVYNKLAGIMSNMYDGMIGMFPYWEDIAQNWVDMMRNAGYDPTASGSSLSEGIKGITENTASLLASYINAIRSDVSQIRLLQTTTNSKITELLSVFPKAPTLADYLTKIEAHTANISADTSAILKQLRSVITTQGGNSAFAVYM